ncbi:MAG: hypothetical protein IT464_11235 [Planctomycetes bacterium]|nr:hypothetical protein [Planctomycetota bacterium]
MTKRGWIFVATLALLVVGVSAGIAQDSAKEEAPPEVKIVESADNQMGAEIWGTWVLKEDLTKHTAGELPKDMAKSKFIFEKSEDSKKAILENLPRVLAAARAANPGDSAAMVAACKTIHLAGKLTVDQGDEKVELHFFMITVSGNQMFCAMGKRGDDWRVETGHVSFVRDPEGSNDLFFLGGEDTKEVYTAWERAK